MKKLFASLLVAASILTPGVAKANNTAEDHHALWKELQNQGVTTIYNHKLHCPKDGSVDGRYYLYSAMLIVCQDNMTAHLVEQPWTENDFDTLRHEAHHVIQDCARGVIGDGVSQPFFDEETYVDFVEASTIPMERLDELFEMMVNDGLDPMTIVEEIEAYIVAYEVPADSIRKKLIETCSK